MKDRNIAQYNHARELAESIVTGNEVVISDFVTGESQQAELLAQRLEDEERAAYLLDKIRNSPKKQNISRLVKEIERMKMKRRRTLLVKSITSVAALLFITIFIFNFNREAPKSTTINESNSSSVPVLITETGKSINLNSVNDDIVTRSYTIEKGGDNMLSYRHSETVTEMETIQYNELRIPSQYTYKIKLDDGTNVTLNACSNLKYPTKFIGNSRMVELQGEGYFEVTKSDKPFLVKVNNMIIKVYGTQFNIKVLNDASVETVLIEGSIGVTIDKDREIVMSPNQLLVYNKETNSSTLSSVDAVNYVEWMSNNFNFVDKPFSTIVDELSKWYGIDFKFHGDISDLNLTLFAERDSSVTEIFGFIEKLTDVKFVKEGGHIYGIYR